MKPIRSRKHLEFIRALPCCCTGNTVDTVPHHLLRTEEKCMGRKSGDDKAIPLNADVHMALHRHGNEALFLKEYGIDGPKLAEQLWGVGGKDGQYDIEAGERIIRSARDE